MDSHGRKNYIRRKYHQWHRFCNTPKVISYGEQWRALFENIMRVITGVPAGTHSFTVQIRSELVGSQFAIHGGNETENYSGFHLLIEEL